MSHQYSVRVEIAAPRHEVWRVMANLEAWPSWTPTMSSVRHRSGTGVGATYEVRQPRMPASTLVIDEWVDGTSFTWSSRERAASLSAHHVLADDGLGRTAVTLSIELSGPLSAIVWLLWGRTIRHYVDTEAAALGVAVASLEP